MKIETGQIVALKSGSPAMTVEELGEHRDAKCAWFFGNELRREWFAIAALRPARVAAPQQSRPTPPPAAPTQVRG